MQILQNSQENICAKDSTEFNFIKKEIPGQMFPCEFCEMSHNAFFKETDGCFCINTRSVYCPYFCFFQKRCHIYFPAEYFLGLIYRLVTVSSIFQTLSQKPIFNSVEHLRWRFFVKIVNSLKLLSIFAKKLHYRCSTRF